jgi:biotin carboxyl carrier protein
VELVIDINGRMRHVTVHGRDGNLLVFVDGRRFEVSARTVGRDGLSLLLQDGDTMVRSVDAAVAALPRGGFEVSIDGHVVQASLVPRRARRGGGAGASGAGPQTVVAPMPGKVVRVLVSRGDEVGPRQGLVVIEAMKMENELRAARAGQVKDVLVTEGQSVEAGVPLVTVE